MTYDPDAYVVIYSITDKESFEQAEEILGVDGVDGCWIGPSDLAKSMGIDRGTPAGAKAHREMIMRVVASCKKTGKIAGISGDLDITFWLQNGLQFVTASYDGGLMLEGARQVFNILSAK